MRNGYGKSKLFMMVLFSVVGIMLMPYGMLGGMGRSKDARAQKQSRYEHALTQNRMQESGPETASQEPEGHDRLDPIVGITVKDAGRDVIYASGNGVVLSCGENGLCIATAKHVLEAVGTGESADRESGYGSVRVWISFWNADNWAGTPDTEAECVSYEMVPDADLVFLYLDGEPVKGLNITPVTLAEKTVYDSLRTGDVVRTIGWDEGQKVVYEGTLQESWIFVEDFSQYMMASECVINPGMSGCGLYNAADELIGIACGGNENGVLVAVPLSVVKARLGEMRNQIKTEKKWN